MHRLVRIGLIVALLALVVGSVGSVHGVSAQGQTYTDNMDSSATGLLNSNSPDPARFIYGYQNSQFIIQSTDASWSGDLLAYAGVPVMGDVTAAVDFAIAGDLTGKYAFVGCRAGDDSNTAYIFEVFPGSGEANLWRFDADSAANLGKATASPAINIGSGNNRIEITCQGGTITGTANGTQVLTAQDATYTSGDVFIGTGKTDATADTLLTGFDNLTITDLGGAAAVPTQAPSQPTAITQPTQAPVEPTQAGGFPTAIPAEPTTATTGGDTTGDGAGLTDPRVDPNGTLSDALVISLLADPAGGPLRAEDTLTASDVKFLSSGVNLSDFYARLNYVTPPAGTQGSWTVGFSFWDDGQGNYYDVVIFASNGTAKWVLGQQSAAGFDILQSGDLAAGAVDFTPGAENYVALAVTQGLALLSGNDLNLGASIDLGGIAGSGDVSAEVAFLASDAAPAETLPVSLSGFGVWDLSPAAVAAVFGAEENTPAVEPTQASSFPTAIPAPPTEAPLQPTQAPLQPTVAGSTGGDVMLTQIFNQARTTAMASAPLFSAPSGVLGQQSTGFGYAPAGISVTDFYATVTFVNPTDLSTRSDVGIGFRDLNNDTEFRFVARTDGVWALAIGVGSPLVTGELTNFDATPGASNTLEIVARGATGLLVVNGVVIQQVDLSANLTAGDVYIATGMYASDSVDGRQVPYSNFAVYGLAA